MRLIFDTASDHDLFNPSGAAQALTGLLSAERPFRLSSMH